MEERVHMIVTSLRLVVLSTVRIVPLRQRLLTIQRKSWKRLNHVWVGGSFCLGNPLAWVADWSTVEVLKPLKTMDV
jgi:hypothetical protein